MRHQGKTSLAVVLAVILALEMIGPASVHAFAEASDGQETVSAEETAVYDEDPTAAGETFPGEEPPAGEVTETEEAEDGEAEEETEAPEGAAEESESAPPAEDEPAAQETDAAETAETAPAEDTEETASEDDVQLVVREENTFTISDGVLTGFSGGGVVRIPETVTRITNDAFYGNSDITEVIIPDTVTSIEDQSFRFCENLESINIPYGITEIGPGMFECCCSLKEIEIPDTVAWIGEYAFEHCSSLQEVDLPASVTQIDTNTFLNCVNLRTVVIRSADASVRGTVFEPSTVIVAPAGSAAQSYAETHGLRFAALGEEAVLTLASAGDGALSVTRNGAALSDGAAIAVGDRLIVRSTTSRGGQYLTANGLDLIFGYTQKAWYYELAFDPMNDPAAGIVLTVNGDMRIEAVYRDPVPLQNALNADGSALDIQTGGDVPLLPAFEQGRDLAAVTALESGQKSYAQIRVTGPGFICYEVQLEESGSFRPLLDGQIAGSGVIKDHAWRQGTIEIPSGTHTVRLELSGPGGGRLDEIFFTDDENSLAIGQITVTDQLDLNIGETQAIAWTTVPAEIGDRTPSWTSDDPSVAEVDAEGHVTAVGRGNTLIHAALDTVSAVCHVYVSSSSVRGDFVYEGNTLTGYTGSDASVVIPDGTEAIAANAFRGHTEITDVTIPSGVTSIGAYAFRGCTSLELVSVPDSVTDIGRFAFPLLESVIVFCQKDSAAYDHAIEYGLRYCLVNDEIQGGDLTLDVYQVMQEAEAVTGQNISGMQEIPVDADEHYTYYLSGGDLYRQEISRDLFDAEPVFSLGSRPAAAKVFGSVIYFALPNTSAGTTRIVGYDTEHSTQVMDQVFPVVIRSAGQFALDADQNLYAVQNSLDTYSFDRNGNKTSENIRSGGFFITGLEQIMLDQVSADGRVLFARYYSAYRALKSTDSDSSFPSLYATRYYEGFMEIRNGRFINDDLMVKNASRAVNAGWVFLENREYAVNRYGEIAEFEWGSSHEGSFDYHVLFRLGRGGDTGTVAADMIGSEIFFATHDGTVTVFDTQQKKVTAHYRLGTEAGVQGLYAVNGVMYVRYTQNGTPMMAPLSAFVREEAHPEIRTDHVSRTHTRSEIRSAYARAQSSFTNAQHYAQTPSWTAPYRAGALSGEVIDATLRMLNYGRWQAGLNPVSLRTEYMERSQKGAVILRALNRLTHTPSQPADMDDDFYHEAYAGVNAAADYTGNCSYGDTLPESIFGYLDDTANLEAGSIGHRLSLLDPRATGTSFGYCESYSALSMYISPAATDNRESYYAWPSAGYFPVEDIDANALWHITTGWYMYSNPAVTLTYDGTDYAAEDLEYDDYYSAFSFRAPDALREQIAGGGRYLPGTTVTVTLTGLYNEEGEEVIVTYPVMFFEPLFRDVTDPEQFYFDPVYWAADEGITTGWSDNTFRPMNNCNRASVVTFLWRMAGRPEPSQMASFTDMTGNTEFDKAISWAAENGITTGWSDGTFRPWNTCNRASIVTFLWRFAGRPEPEGENTFSDKTGDPEFDLAIAWAAGNGITTGWSDGTFRPWNTCNRLAVVSFLYRYAHPQG